MRALSLPVPVTWLQQGLLSRSDVARRRVGHYHYRNNINRGVFLHETYKHNQDSFLHGKTCARIVKNEPEAKR